MSQANKPSANTTLRDFADLKRALKDAAKEAAARAEKEKADRAKREATQRSKEADSAMFKRTVGQVHGLPDTGRVDIRQARPQPIPASRHLDEKAVLHESLSDEFDVESLLETDESLSWRRPEIGIDVVRKLRRGVWALQGELDLHGLRTDEAREQMSLFMRDAQLKGLRCVRIVHGKGLGSPGKQPVLKDKVKRWLVQSDRVLAFVQARADEGGLGAVVVLLNPGKGASPAAAG
ncbi:MAG: Smr/MutS family protein [Aquabacterium sp.]